MAIMSIHITYLLPLIVSSFYCVIVVTHEMKSCDYKYKSTTGVCKVWRYAGKMRNSPNLLFLVYCENMIGVLGVGG
jgi:hypothetical protein